MMSNRFVSIQPCGSLAPDERAPYLTVNGTDTGTSPRRWPPKSRPDHPDAETLHLVCVLKGAFVFLADLVRALRIPSTLDFMAVSSYAKGTTTTGEVRLLKDLDMALDGRHVVIVEDIVDTGLTLTYLQDILRARGPEDAAHGVPAEQAVAPQGERPGGVHRFHDRGPLRRRLRPGLRRATPQPSVHRRPRLGHGASERSWPQRHRAHRGLR